MPSFDWMVILADVDISPNPNNFISGPLNPNTLKNWNPNTFFSKLKESVNLSVWSVSCLFKDALNDISTVCLFLNPVVLQ